jgi:hypothetical protein
MRQARVLVFILTTVLVAGSWLWGQDTKQAKAKMTLPKYWSSLKLSDEQKQKAVAILTEYRKKIDVLKQQIVELERQESGELEKILSDDQKKELQRVIARKVPGSGGPSKEEPKKEEKKPDTEKKP